MLDEPLNIEAQKSKDWNEKLSQPWTKKWVNGRVGGGGGSEKILLFVKSFHASRLLEEEFKRGHINIDLQIISEKHFRFNRFSVWLGSRPQITY